MKKLYGTASRNSFAEGADLKEGLLWFGPLATSRRRATQLPGPHTLTDGSAPSPPLMIRRGGCRLHPLPRRYARGSCLGTGRSLGASQLDSELAYLTALSVSKLPSRVPTRLMPGCRSI